METWRWGRILCFREERLSTHSSSVQNGHSFSVAHLSALKPCSTGRGPLGPRTSSSHWKTECLSWLNLQELNGINVIILLFRTFTHQGKKKDCTQAEKRQLELHPSLLRTDDWPSSRWTLPIWTLASDRQPDSRMTSMTQHHHHVND